MSKSPVRLDVNPIVRPSGDRLAHPSTAGVLIPGPLPGKVAKFRGSDQLSKDGMEIAVPASASVVNASVATLAMISSC
jgi:hypothetical protein